MSKVVYAISVSLDGFVAGADDNPDRGMGRGGEILHQWAYQLDATPSANTVHLGYEVVR